MIVLEQNPKGDTYKELMDVCFEVCDRFHLVLRKDMGPLDDFDDFLRKIEKALIEMKEESEWASQILGDGQTAKVYYYHTNDEDVKRIIKESVNSLYEWEMHDCPEDLTFFKGDAVWLATVSHEEECYIFPDGEEEYAKVMNIKGLKASIEEDE
jgi:hypothetical protein